MSRRKDSLEQLCWVDESNQYPARYTYHYVLNKENYYSNKVRLVKNSRTKKYIWQSSAEDPDPIKPFTIVGGGTFY